MSYEHKMEAFITALPGVTIDQLNEALHPLVDYFGFKSVSAAFATKVIPNKDGKNVISIEIETEGDVKYSYDDIVETCAKNLATLCEPDYFKLVNYDLSEPEDAVQRIWFGEPDAVEREKRILAWKIAQEKLIEGGYDYAEIDSLSEMVETLDENRKMFSGHSNSFKQNP